MSISQFPDIFGQPLGRRYLYALQEHWDHGDISLEGSGNFVSYEVRGIFEATIAFDVFGIQPTGADKREEEIARFEPLVQNVAKVLPRVDVVHIHEHRALANQFDQVVLQSSRLTLRVPASIAHEDSAHRALLQVPQRYGLATSSASPPPPISRTRCRSSAEHSTQRFMTYLF